MSHIIDNLNYATDPRTRDYPEDGPVLTFWLGDDEDTEVSIPIPEHGYQWVVCPLCEGRGKHVNPSIDCNGISPDEFAEDPDFAEAYFRGDYDQTCNQCRGRTTVRQLCPERFLSAEDLAAYERHCEEQARLDAEDRATYLAELRMGA